MRKLISRVIDEISGLVTITLEALQTLALGMLYLSTKALI
jgi:hypothetical protein